MKRSGERSTVRRMLIGAAYGAGIGVFLAYFGYDGDCDPSGRGQLRVVAECAMVFGVLGGMAGGSLRAASWRLFAGGALGAVAFGAFGVLATLHIKGLVYAPLGAPFGALFVFLREAARQELKPADKAPMQAPSCGVWDH